MTLQKAIEIFVKKYPGRLVSGYWEKDGGFIFNTRKTALNEGLTEPGQFVVTEDGKVYGTNPLRVNLDPKKMKKI